MEGSRQNWRVPLRRAYAGVALGLIALYPFLPELWKAVVMLAWRLGTAACVLVGRRAVERGRRAPWTLLVCALALFVAANAALLSADDRVVAAGWLIDATGDLLALAAALTMVVRRGARDLGGIVDAAVLAFAVGSLLWAALPHRLYADRGFTAQVDLFVVVFALTGVLGALIRLYRMATEPRSALRWLLVAIGLAISGETIAASGDGSPAGSTATGMVLLAAFAAIGLFGLDPTGPELVYAQAVTRIEQLSTARLILLGAAVAVIPAVASARLSWHAGGTGVLLAVQGTLVAALVMVRVGILAAQRAEAERTLAQRATHDPLTGLPNRREFVRRLVEALARDDRNAVLFCDVDDFKMVNDRFGHEAGDALLIDVAQRLRGCVDRRHEVSRFGGDEFVVLLAGVTEADVRSICDCVTDALARPYDAAEGGGVTISIGIANSDGERDPERLIKAADDAMYRVKATHRTRDRRSGG